MPQTVPSPASIRLRRATTVCLAVLALATVVLSGALGSPVTWAGQSAQLPTPTPPTVPTVFPYVATGGGRHFYLTSTSYNTDQVLNACAPGYHMASLWEIVDVSNLVYDWDHPAAYTKADSGQGPPSFWYGWVRTGFDSSSSSATGAGNCASWTTRSSSAYGVSVRLSYSWEALPGEIGGIWDATSFPCNYSGPVWCVGDFHALYLPAVMRNAQQ